MDRSPTLPTGAAAASADEPGLERRREGLLATLGGTVRSLRAARGLSQQSLARRAGLSPRFVAQLEAGEGNISVAKLAELARALEVPLARLVAGEDGVDTGDVGGDRDLEPGSETAALRREIALRLAERSPAELRAVLAALREQRGEPPPATALIALVGLRGAGKSTLGPLLAQALGRPFVELDQEIQERTGLAVSEIFELHGERYYRQAERDALEALIARNDPAVFALSGGAVTDPLVFELLKAHTLLVWVRASPEQHMQRVTSQGDRRPMANRPNAMIELRNLLRARMPYYTQAHAVADTRREGPADCVLRLAAQMRALGAS